MITAVIPVRLSVERLYDETRRITRIVQSIPKDYFKVLIIDYGTVSERSYELSDIAENFDHVDIYRVDSEGLPFSIGRARDIGAQQSTTDIIMFHDIDFLCSKKTYHRLFEEVERRKFDKRGYDFLCVPTIFLTIHGTELYLDGYESGNGYHVDQSIHDYALKGRRQYVKHVALGSSATVMNRYYYLTTGGHDPSFVGHGAEDFEFYHRVARETPRSGRPKKYYENITQFDGRYEGFRSFFALYGADVFMRGISMVHLEHPRREATDKSYRRSQNNFKLLQRRMKETDAGGCQLAPLSDPRSSHKTLVMVDPHSKPAKAIRQVLPALGVYDWFPERWFETAEDLLSVIQKRGFTQVFFLNPYGNPHRQELYAAVKKNKIPFIVFDRGALPDSWFFDRGGFLGDSDSYSESLWNKPLDSTKESKIKVWLDNFRDSDNTLEHNGIRRSSEYWRSCFSLGEREVIIVALQRPNDTATRIFAGPVESTEQFNQWIGGLAKHINPAEVVILVKRHPLESEQPDIEGVLFVPDDTHVHDLIELADRVVVINSGVGLLALAFGKPVIVCGNAFYAHPGLAYQANSFDELLDLSGAKLDVDEAALYKYLYYLVFNFYSFGKSGYETAKDSDGKAIKIVSKIEFSYIRNVLPEPVEIGEQPNQVPLKSYLMQISGAGIDSSSASKKSDSAVSPRPVKKDNLAIRIYRGSRSVPIMEQVVDVFVPLYEYLERKKIIN